MSHRAGRIVRRGAALGVAAGLHLGLAALWASQRPTLPVYPPQPPPLQVRLEPPRPVPPVSTVAVPANQGTPSPTARRLARGSTPTASSGIATARPAQPAGTADVADEPPSLPQVAPALARALADRQGCVDVTRLSRDARERCQQRFAATAYQALPETNPLALQADHYALMAGVRQVENRSRATCDQMRNLDPTCINLLPDNLPEDDVPVPARRKPKPITRRP